MNCLNIILICSSILIPIVNGLSFESFTRAIDDRDKQMDIYAPHSVALSRKYNGHILAFFMNSLVHGATEESVMARDVSGPYVVMKWNGRPTVICNDPNSNYTKMISPGRERLLPIKQFEIGRYDFIYQTFYSYANEILYMYKFSNLKLIATVSIGNITDFYVNADRLYATNNCQNLGNTHCSNGKFNTFEIVNASIAVKTIIRTLIFCLIVVYVLTELK